MKIEIFLLENIWGLNSLKVYFCLFGILLCLSNFAFAQLDSTAIITEDVLDNILIEPEEESDSEGLVEIVEYLIHNPVDLNTIDLIELSKIPNIDLQSAQK